MQGERERRARPWRAVLALLALLVAARAGATPEDPDALGPPTPEQVLQREQQALLRGIDFSTHAFALESVQPAPGATGVPSALVEIVLTFENVTDNAGSGGGWLSGSHAVKKRRRHSAEDGAPALLRRCVALAVDQTTSNHSTWERMWVRVHSLGKAGTAVLESNITSSTSQVVVAEDGKLVLRLRLPQDGVALEYDTQYELELSPSARGGLEELLSTGKWQFRTEQAPEQPGAATETEVKEIRVYGVGIYMLDVGDVDVRKGIFKADVQIFVLEYYHVFTDQETAIREAMHGNRSCKDVSSGEKFQYLPMEDPLVVKLTFINAGTLHSEIISGSGVLDHFRVRADFKFSPHIENYPFQDQSLPIMLELAGESVTTDPSALLCVLDSFSGFAKELASLSSENADSTSSEPTFTGHFDVSENTFWPPLRGTFVPPYRFPHDGAIARQPMRTSSRLSWVVTLHRPRFIGFLELAPALFVASSALVSYLLPLTEFRARLTTCTTSLLAAVVQHSSLRSRVPERSAATIADLVMLVVYSIITAAMLSSVLLGAIVSHRRHGPKAEYYNSCLRAFGLSSPLLFSVFLVSGGRDIFAWFATFVIVGLSALFVQRASAHGVALGLSLKGSAPGLYSRIRVGDLPEAAGGWSPQDVADWIESLDLPGITQSELRRYADHFFKERVDGVALSHLSTAGIGSLGIPLGHSIKLHEAVAGLLRESAEVTGPSEPESGQAGDDPLPRPGLTHSEVEMSSR